MTNSNVVSVIIPCRNEANTIASVLEDLAKQKYEAPYEVIVADGYSDDETWDILRAHEQAGGYPYQLKLLRNSARGIPQALNLLVANAIGEYIVRIDGHSRIAPDYLKSIVAALRMSGVDVVGPRIKHLPSDQTLKAEVIAAVLNSSFGNGGTPSRNYLPSAVPVKHAVMSCYRRKVWEKIGGYDEGLISNEDFDFDYRANLAGFKVYAAPIPTFCVISRPNLLALARQRWRYGLAKAQLLRKFPKSLHIRQLVPILALPGLVLAAFWPVLLVGLGLVYLFITIAVLKQSDLAQKVSGLGGWIKTGFIGFITAMIVHFVWSAGVWWGGLYFYVRFPSRKRIFLGSAPRGKNY